MNSESELEYIDVRRLCLLLAYLQNPHNVTLTLCSLEIATRFNSCGTSSARPGGSRLRRCTPL